MTKFRPTRCMPQMTDVTSTRPDRKTLLRLVWKYTHRDYRGVRADGTKVVNHNCGAAGTCSVPLDSLSDDALWHKLPATVRAGSR